MKTYKTTLETKTHKLATTHVQYAYCFIFKLVHMFTCQTTEKLYKLSSTQTTFEKK